jgi:hypothetical protein
MQKFLFQQLRFCLQNRHIQFTDAASFLERMSTGSARLQSHSPVLQAEPFPVSVISNTIEQRVKLYHQS